MNSIRFKHRFGCCPALKFQVSKVDTHVKSPFYMDLGIQEFRIITRS